MAGQAFEYRSDELQSLESDATDPFGHRDYANTVVEELRDFPNQFTLGLFGDWGSGKSTILKQIGEQLQKDETISTAYVLFDAWRYEGDSLRREFIRTVGQELEKQKALKRGFDLDHHTEAFETETTVSRRRLGFDPRAFVVAALLVLAAVGALVLLLPKLGLSQANTLKVMLAFSGPLTAFALVALQKVVTPDPIQATRRRLEFPDQFAANFKELLRNVRAQRLVIAIDNLDRCSPGRVTEILSSIKTFLEPAFAEGSNETKPTTAETIRQLLGERQTSLTRMSFIVAADDAALRRHLTAQELSKKNWKEGNAPAENELPLEVRTAVDEYLRKFFGASLRIRGLLDEDIRRFTAGELEQFNLSRKLDKDLSRRLVELTSQGLKRNPRRIKQFVNNLQLRLQMLAERKEKGRIQIDPDVLVVAKLAILEEEFVEEFEELEKDPTLLSTWHGRARAPDREDRETDGPRLNPQLASFLRFTDDIQPRDIRAYLNLKQTESELRLPRYGEFVELLDDGDVKRLEQMLKEEAGEESKYTEAARAHLLEQRKAGSYSRAHNALRSVVEVPLLHGEEGRVAREALEVALQEPALEERLGLLGPRELLYVAIQYRLPRAKLMRVLAQVIGTLGPAAASDARLAAAEALAEHSIALEEQEKNQIRQLLRSEEVVSDFDSYLPLALKVPEVLTHEILDAALNRIEELGPAGAATDQPAFAVAVQTLATSPDTARVDRLLRLSQPGLAAHLESGSEHFGPVTAGLAKAIAASGPTEWMPELAGWLANNRSTIPAQAQQDALTLALLLSFISPESDTSTGPAIAEWIFELDDGEATVAIIERNFNRLPPQMLSKIRGLLSGKLAGEAHHLSEGQIEEALSLFPPDDQVHIVREALGLAIAHERLEVAGSLLKRLDAEEQDQVIADALGRAEGAPASQTGDLRFVVTQRSRLNEEQLHNLALKIAQTVFENRRSVQQLAPLLGELELSSPDQRLELVEHMINTERDMSSQANREAMLRAAWRCAGRPRSKARNAIEERLQELQADPSFADLTAELL